MSYQLGFGHHLAAQQHSASRTRGNWWQQNVLFCFFFFIKVQQTWILKKKKFFVPTISGRKPKIPSSSKKDLSGVVIDLFHLCFLSDFAAFWPFSFCPCPLHDPPARHSSLFHVSMSAVFAFTSLLSGWKQGGKSRRCSLSTWPTDTVLPRRSSHRNSSVCPQITEHSVLEALAIEFYWLQLSIFWFNYRISNAYSMWQKWQIILSDNPEVSNFIVKYVCLFVFLPTMNFSYL